MKERNITAKQLSNDTGISTGNISDWKNGRSKPSIEKIYKLATYFDVSVDYLLGKESIKRDVTMQEVEQIYRIKKLFTEKGLPFNNSTVDLFLDVVAVNAEIIKKQIEKNK